MCVTASANCRFDPIKKHHRLTGRQRLQLRATVGLYQHQALWQGLPVLALQLRTGHGGVLFERL